MFKWERKLTEYVERWLPGIVLVLVTLIALLVRRDGLWHICRDYENAFYPDAPGYLHTSFYGLVIWLISHIPMTPIRTVKILIGIFDFGVALCSLLWIRDRKDGRLSGEQALFCYTLCLITPLSIANGIVWIHMDAICLCAVLEALVLYRKERHLWVGLLLGLAASLQAQYLAFLLFFWVLGLAGRKRKLLTGLGVGTVLLAALTAAGSIWSGMGTAESLWGLYNWLLIDPATGLAFAGILPWLKAMAGYFGYVAGMLGMLYTFARPRYWWAGAVLHVGATLYLAQILQYGY